MEGTNVGTITLDLKIANTIEAQLGEIESQVTKSAQKRFGRVGETIAQQFKTAFTKAGNGVKIDTKSLDVSASKVRAVTKGMSRAFESARLKLSDVNVELTKLQTQMTEIENSTKDSLKDLFPDKDDLYKATEAALEQDKAYQKLGQRMDQLLLKSDQLKARMTLVGNGADPLAQEPAGNTGDGGTKRILGNTKEAVGAAKQLEQTGTRAASRIGTAFTKVGKMIKGAFKAVFITAGLYAGFRGLQSMLQNAVSQNEEFQKSLAQIRGSLSAAFEPIFTAIAPALNWLISMLASAARAIASFVNGLFGGISKKAKSTTKDIKGVGGAAEQAGGLASFDRINNLNGSKGGGGGGNVAATEFEVDPNAFATGERIKAMLKGIKNAVNKYKEPIVAGLTGIGAAFAMVFAADQLNAMGGFKKAFSALGKTVKSAFSFFNPAAVAVGVLTGALVYLYQTNDMVKNKLNAAWGIIQKVIADVVQQVNSLLLPVFDAVKSALLTIWNDVVRPIALLLVDIISDVITSFQTLWNEYGETTFQKIRECIETVKKLFQSAWDNVFKPIFDVLFGAISQLWYDHLQPFLDKFGNFVGTLIGFASDIFNYVISPIMTWFSEAFGPFFSGILDGAVGFFRLFLGDIVDAISNLMGALSSIIDFITSVFKGDWCKVWESVVNAFANIWGAISEVACAALNAVIAVVNLLIDAYNASIGAVGNFLIGWLGGDISIARIPYIRHPAKRGSNTGGGRLNGLGYVPYDGFYTMLHKGEAVLTAKENKLISEAGGLRTVLSKLRETPALTMSGVSGTAHNPASDNSGLISVINKLLSTGRGESAAYHGDVVFQIGEETIGRAAVTYILNYIRTHGESPIPLGV